MSQKESVTTARFEDGLSQLSHHPLPAKGDEKDSGQSGSTSHAFTLLRRAVTAHAVVQLQPRLVSPKYGMAQPST
jgi:hypothetical protein